MGTEALTRERPLVDLVASDRIALQREPASQESRP
jgi:hypothetical protein